MTVLPPSAPFDRAAYAAEMNARYDALDEALVEAGFPATSVWWREQVRRYFDTNCRQAVFRVGRRGGKSSTLCRIAVIEGLYGAHAVPPGDLGVVAFISVSRDESSQRLRTIKAILDALGVKYRPIDGGIELETRAVAFKVYTASVAGVSGFTAICVICDEVSKWKDADTGANPATEVLASVRPTVATQLRAKIILSSSAMGRDDAHARAFDEGDSDFQFVAYAPTWVAHPAISEAETHRLEPVEKVWRREYLGEAQASASAAFEYEHVVRAFGAPHPDGFEQCHRVILVDPTAGQGDTWAAAAVGWRVQKATARYLTKRTWSRSAGEHIDVLINDEHGNRIPNPDWKDERPAVLVFDAIAGIDNAMATGVTSDQIVQFVMRMRNYYGAVCIHSDQFERYSLQSAFTRYGVPFIPHVWSAPLKQAAVERVRRWLADGTLILPQHEQTKQQLLAFTEYITPSTGGLSFRGRQGGKDDYAMLIMLAAFVDIEGMMPGSPLAPVQRSTDDIFRNPDLPGGRWIP